MGLQADNRHTTCSIQVSWQEARGVADGYSLQLLDDRGHLVTNRYYYLCILLAFLYLLYEPLQLN